MSSDTALPGLHPRCRGTTVSHWSDWAAVGSALLCLLSASCQQHVNAPTPQNPKTTTPVHGTVTVDGEPGWGVRVTLNPTAGMDAANPTVSYGEADRDGKFQISTYGGNDGAPPGEYMLTFQWFDRSNVIIGAAAEKDLFDGKYAEKSEHVITVPSGPQPFDAGTIELLSQ